jgi:hypothetical protein
MIPVHELITYLSFFLPLVHEIAITLTHSKLPLFDGLYRSCLEDSFLEYGKRAAIKQHICSTQDYLQKLAIDLIAYVGLMLFIGKNTLRHGYVTGVATGLVLIFVANILPTMFLGIAIERIVHAMGLTSPYAYILVGLGLITLLIVTLGVLEKWTQELTKGIRIDPVDEQNIKRREN